MVSVCACVCVWSLVGRRWVSDQCRQFFEAGSFYSWFAQFQVLYELVCLALHFDHFPVVRLGILLQKVVVDEFFLIFCPWHFEPVLFRHILAPRASQGLLQARLDVTLEVRH